VAAWHDRNLGKSYTAALAIYVVAGLGFVGLVLWRLWTEVLGGVPL
jgi:hypothetical protein